MGLFSRKQDTFVDPSTVSPDDAIRLAREAMANTRTFENTSGQRRKISAEQRASMHSIFDRVEAARAKG
jgi:hypothetical protein